MRCKRISMTLLCPEDVDEALASGASESILCKASCTLILSSSFTSKIASGAQYQIPTRLALFKAISLVILAQIPFVCSASGGRRREVSTRFSVKRIYLSSVFAAVAGSDRRIPQEFLELLGVLRLPRAT